MIKGVTPLEPSPTLDPIDRAIWNHFPDYWGECYRLMSQRKFNRKYLRERIDKLGLTSVDEVLQFLNTQYPKQ